MTDQAAMARDREIIRLAFELARVVEVFVEHARQYFYEVALSGYTCPRCGGRLEMLGESHCRCAACGYVFDPTAAFQRCTACGGRVRLRICRYQCCQCGLDVPSRFVFDGVVFDREYFREHMAESRKRKREQREYLGRVAAENRSDALEPPAADLDAIPGLVEALNSLVTVPDMNVWIPFAKGFDLNRYQKHIQAHLGQYETQFDDIPALENNSRLDRIWRFIAIVFMAHAGGIQIRQQGSTILVVKPDETDSEGS